MLVLSRKPGETVVTSNGISVTVAEVNGNRVRLAFVAPDDVEILRAELSGRAKKQPQLTTVNVGKTWTAARATKPRKVSAFPGRFISEWANHFAATTRSASRLPPKTEQTGTVKIITFTAGQVRLENVIESELAGLTDDLSECHLLLDLTNIKHVTGLEIGTFVNLHNKMQASGGRLTLFNLNVQVFEVFLATHLEALIAICR